MRRTACTEPQCLYSRAKPLLPLWAVRPVQSLSACTVELNLYSPSGPYGLHRASVPVQYSYTSTPPTGRTACTEPKCLYSRAKPLLPLWAVRPVQSLSAGTRNILRPYIQHTIEWYINNIATHNFKKTAQQKTPIITENYCNMFLLTYFIIVFHIFYISCIYLIF